jgi:hypothetical protein
MADSPWAGITNLGALEQKLYQQPKSEPPLPSPAGAKPEAKPHKKIVTLEKAAVPDREIRMTLPLPQSSLALLDQVERTIFAQRDITYRSKQRLTKNSVARSWISLLEEVDIDWTNIKDESDLKDRLRKALKV